VTKQGKRLRTRLFEVRILASPLVHPRIGFVIPKHNRSGVERNTLKRKLREIVRVEILAVLPAVDLIIKSRPDAYHADFKAIASDLRKMADEIARLAT